MIARTYEARNSFVSQADIDQAQQLAEEAHELASAAWDRGEE